MYCKLPTKKSEVINNELSLIHRESDFDTNICRMNIRKFHVTLQDGVANSNTI